MDDENESGYGFEEGEAKMAAKEPSLQEQSGYGNDQPTSELLPPVGKPKESNTIDDMPRDSTGALTPQRVANPDSSRRTDTQANGFQTQIIGGGNLPQGGYRQMQPTAGTSGVGNMMPPAGPGPLTRAETMQMQKLQNGVNTVQQQVATGEVSEQDGQRMMRIINRQLGPLQKRQAASRVHQMMSDNHDQQVQTGLADGLQNLRDQQLSQAFQKKVIQVKGLNGEMHQGYLDDKGKFTSFEWEKSRYKAKESGGSDPRQVEQDLAQGYSKEAREHHRHMADDYDKVYKSVRDAHVDEHGKLTKSEDELHKLTTEHINQRNLNIAERQGKQAYIQEVSRIYGKGEDAPPEVQEKMKKALVNESPLGGRF